MGVMTCCKCGKQVDVDWHDYAFGINQCIDCAMGLEDEEEPNTQRRLHRTHEDNA